MWGLQSFPNAYLVNLKGLYNNTKVSLLLFEILPPDINKLLENLVHSHHFSNLLGT